MLLANDRELLFVFIYPSPGMNLFWWDQFWLRNQRANDRKSICVILPQEGNAFHSACRSADYLAISFVDCTFPVQCHDPLSSGVAANRSAIRSMLRCLNIRRLCKQATQTKPHFTALIGWKSLQPWTRIKKKGIWFLSLKRTFNGWELSEFIASLQIPCWQFPW